MYVDDQMILLNSQIFIRQFNLKLFFSRKLPASRHFRVILHLLKSSSKLRILSFKIRYRSNRNIAFVINRNLNAQQLGQSILQTNQSLYFFVEFIATITDLMLDIEIHRVQVHVVRSLEPGERFAEANEVLIAL